MRFTGVNSVLLPNVAKFSFVITGIKATDTGVKSFTFYDNAISSFAFKFASGYITTDRIVGTYNTNDETNISGYYSIGNVLNYKVNGIFHQLPITFGKLNSFVVDAGTGKVYADVAFSSNPISYSVALDSGYAISGNLTGALTSDTSFPVGPPSFIFYNSNKNLLSNPYSTGFATKSGKFNLSFTDIDSTYMEYNNDFYLSLPTPFGDIGQKFMPRKTGAAASSVLFLADASGNNYYRTSQFEGTWSGKSFKYVDNVLTYNLSFDYSNTSADGNDYPSTLSIRFEPLAPKHNSGYAAQYVTGFTLTNSGKYSKPPTFSGSQYYYVTGVQSPFQSFLFSTGCGNSVNVTYSGGNSISGASGALLLKQIKISGIYNTGIAFFNMVTGYSGINNGFGYQSAPIFHVVTGGGCYSLPDLSGVELYQFKKASGYGAIYAQAAGLTGVPVMVGSGVSGVSLGNIGMGYSSLLPPNVSFIRTSGDTATGNASGTFQYKQSGTYNFNNFWNVSYSLREGFTPFSGYSGFYYNTLGVNGAGSVKLQITCSGLDNTAAVSGLLTVILSGRNTALTGQRVVSQSRTFDLSTGALFPLAFPANLTQPLPDLSYNLNQDQYDYQYSSDGGRKVDSIINF